LQAQSIKYFGSEKKSADVIIWAIRAATSGFFHHVTSEMAVKPK
jgi:hypothetical protein